MADSTTDTTTDTTATTSIHVHAPRSVDRRMVNWCPYEKARRRMVAAVYVWYSPTITCCGCGRRFADGVSLPGGKAERERRAVEAGLRWERALPVADADVAIERMFDGELGLPFDDRGDDVSPVPEAEAGSG